jgi:hypothetical protein
MSSTAPPSFVDDGSSLQKRVPHGRHPSHITNWPHTSDSDTTSTYTGSYIDDGADMLLPAHTAPGFGAIDPRFYKQRKRRGDNGHGAWNEDIQKAVGGDIGRSLARLRGVGGVEVKRRGEKTYEKKVDTVTIPVPRKWDTIVIKGEDGRVVVIDKDGEFDSGPAEPVQEMGGKKWVKAPITLDLPIRQKNEHEREKKKEQVLEPQKEVLESEYEDIHQPSARKDLLSPTDFFMTGGASGWPGREHTAVMETIKSERSNSKRSSKVKVKRNSPMRSLPGSWPSPLHSVTKTLSVSDKSTEAIGSVESWGEAKSQPSRRSGKSSGDADNLSTKTYSTYKPATVEDAPDTSSEYESILKEADWGGSAKGSVGGRGGSKKSSTSKWAANKPTSKQSYTGSNKSWKGDVWAAGSPASDHNPPPSLQNWIGDRVETISESSTHKSRHRSRTSSHEPQWPSSARPSEASWDGYEIPKTASEVSVAGTGSERSWLQGSQAPSIHDSKASSHRSCRSGRHGSRTGWHSWEGSQEANVEERTESEGWKDGKGGYANGYDEDNKTYLNEDWSGIRVRVGRRRSRESVSGWQ